MEWLPGNETASVVRHRGTGGVPLPAAHEGRVTAVVRGSSQFLQVNIWLLNYLITHSTFRTVLERKFVDVATACVLSACRCVCT
jgi:hypothetical protein